MAFFLFLWKDSVRYNLHTTKLTAWVCFAHFLAHLFRNQPQSNFIKLLTLKETSDLLVGRQGEAI